MRLLFGTVPPLVFWGRLFALLFALLTCSWLLNRLGLVAWRVDFAFLLGFGVLAGLGTSLVEETVFRGILLKPPPLGASGFGVSVLSGLLFALWHPLQTFLYRPLWEAHAWAWWFLLGTALLGYVCARLTIATRSIWPAIALHWLIAVGWKTLYGIPSCGPAARALCQQ